jgi:hypothetical protein
MTCSCINGFCCSHIGRRGMLAGLAAAPLLTASAIPKFALAADPSPATTKKRILIKGGYVLSIDKGVGDLNSGDVLV